VSGGLALFFLGVWTGLQVSVWKARRVIQANLLAYARHYQGEDVYQELLRRFERGDLE
jgi:hypothetical protein